MISILKREIKSYFCSVTGYMFCAFMLLFAGIYTVAVNVALFGVLTRVYYNKENHLRRVLKKHRVLQNRHKDFRNLFLF